MDFFSFEKELQRRSITPNFFISKNYFEASKLVILEENNKMVVRDSDGVIKFPVIDLNSDNFVTELGCETDFEEFEGNGKKSFFDKEYFYKADRFKDLKGGKFKVFRKNCNKLSKWGTEYKKVDDEDLVVSCFEQWASDKEIFDLETIISYLFISDTIKGLFYKGELLGFNLWDSNYKFINYRYCFDGGKIKFLNEYLRLNFYLDMSNKVVNDGGVLGSESLKRFKDKLNPVSIKERYSWTNF